MAIINCTSCGAQIDSTARFCRACGQQVFASEAPTARMETYPQPGAETQGFGPVMTSPTFGPPAMQAPDTNPFDTAKRKRTLTVVIGMIVFLILAMIGLGIGLMFWTKDHPVRSGPQPPPFTGETSNKGDLIYPGAKISFRVNGDNGEKVLQLRTDDSVEDVVNWYEKKIGPTKKVQIPGVGTTLTDGDTTAVISGIGDGTQIIVTQK